MIDLLHNQAQTRPTAPFVLYEQESYDFASMDDIALRGAAWLTQRGVRPGDHVMLAVSNRPLFLFYWFSIAACGAVCVPISHDTFGESLHYMATQSDSSLILTETGEAMRMADTLADTGIPIVAFESEAAFRHEVSRFEPVTVLPVKSGAPVAILYTSGTTGLPKGVVIPAAAYHAIGRKIVEAISITAQDRILTFLPLHHANPQMYSLMSCLTTGCSMALATRFSASRFIEQVEHYGATGFTYVGTVLSILAKEIQHDVRSSLRFCVGGGAPRAIWQELAPRLHVSIHELYGMTETGGMVTINTGEKNRFGSVGVSRDDFDVVVLDDDDNIVYEGVGEIAVRPRSPNVMNSGYYKKPEETAKATSNLWFHTGDLGRFDADGFLYFEGRKKELIRRAGEMISPVAIELCALKHSAVADCAAVGVPDLIMEEEVKLVVVARGELQPGVLITFLEQSLPKHMIPRYIEFVQQIPKTPTQKVQRFKLTSVTDATHDMKRRG